MTDTLTLPPQFLTAVGVHDTGWFETGGFLLARRESPARIVVATGPPSGSDRARGSIAFNREGVDEAAAAAGLVVTGCWHSHCPNPHGTEPSPDDRDAWRGELERSSPGLDTWYGVIVLRDGGRTEQVAAWRTQRRGVCERVPLPQPTEQARTIARSLSFQYSRGPLVEPPSRWDPTLVRAELERLEFQVEFEERFYRNAALKRLGFEPLKPLSKPKPASQVIRRVPAPRRIRPADETDELRRRQEWLGDDVPFELIVENLRRELEAYRRWHG